MAAAGRRALVPNDNDGQLKLEAVVLSLDGRQKLVAVASDSPDQAEALGRSDGSTPNEPVRRTRTRSPIALTSVTIAAQPVGDLVEGDVLLGRLAEGLVHDRDRTDAADGLLERGLGVGPPMRRAWRRSRAATVWRLFFTRWWISRMVASLVTSSRSRRRRSVTSRSSTRAPTVGLGRSGMARTISDHVVGADLGVAMRPAEQHRAEGLLVGPVQRRHQARGSPRPARARSGRRSARGAGRPTARWGSRR